MTPEARTEAIDELSQTPDLLQQLVLDVDEARLDQAAPGEWSARTVIAHLLSTEWQVYRVRLERILTEDKPAVPIFDETRWAQEYVEHLLEVGSKLVTDLTVQRAASIRLLESVRGDEWTRAAIHPQYGEITIDWIVEQWLKHDRNHLKQLTELLKENED